MNITYSEIFFSAQGEAKFAGYPAVWIRLAGCNLECQGFGQKDPTDPSTYILPYKDFDVSSVTKMEELPVWQYGCDSSYSWSSRFKHLFHKGNVQEVVDRLIEVNRSTHNPEGLFVHPQTGQVIMLCFTGGEPMLQQSALVEIMRELQSRGNTPMLVTVETNGTRKLAGVLDDFLTHEYMGQWHFAISPKLFAVSGEKDVVKYENLIDYTNACGSTILKFVVNDTARCWDELDTHVANIRAQFAAAETWVPDIWVMPVGATADVQGNIGDLATEAIRRGFYLATRNHVYVWGNVLGK